MLNRGVPFLVIGLALCVGVGVSSPAAARGVGAGVDGGTITVSDSSPGSPGSGSPGSSTSGGRSGVQMVCDSVPIPEDSILAKQADETGEKLWQCHYINMDGLGLGASSFLVWKADDPSAADPETIAQEIVTSMDLAALPLSMVPKEGPGVYGLVGLPVWFWTPANQWKEKTKSKSSGGLNVSVTAKVDRVVIRPGDGSTVTCMGPGTKYRESFGIKRSPDCGHVYEEKSGAGRKYSITATTYWKARWTGGNQSGTIDLDFSTNARLAIGEAQALRQ